MKNLKVAVVSYNELAFYSREILRVAGILVLVLHRAFTKDGKKGPEFVRRDDSQWQKVLSAKDELSDVVLFVGKKDSGGVAMIHRACEDFADRPHKLFFVICQHEIEEKNAVLDSYGISMTRRYEFKFRDADPATGEQLPCDENVALEGVMLRCVRELNARNEKIVSR